MIEKALSNKGLADLLVAKLYRSSFFTPQGARYTLRWTFEEMN